MNLKGITNEGQSISSVIHLVTWWPRGMVTGEVCQHSQLRAPTLAILTAGLQPVAQRPCSSCQWHRLTQYIKLSISCRRWVDQSVKLRLSLYSYHNLGHYPSSCHLLKKTTFWKMDYVSVFSWKLLRWAQFIELVSVSRPETGQWIMSRIVIVILIYHRHKPIDSINLLGS
jgi:hypothetical protein